jgi:FkbM family methyltransferase
MRWPRPPGSRHNQSTLPGDRVFDQSATEADIRACFRLLLGRHPNKEEWIGHTMRIGQDLAGVVASYLNSLEFTRRSLIGNSSLGDVTLAQVPGFRIYAACNDAAVGRYVRDNNYELDVTAVFQSVLKEGMQVIDIGANIGYFTLLSAALVRPAGHVLAIEPNPRNARLIEASRRENGFENITICQTAAGRRAGTLVLNTSHSNGTTSDLPPEVEALLAAESVPCLAVDTIVPETTMIDLIKVDVEGAEYNALLGASKTISRCRPIIVSEVSPAMMPGISGIEATEYLMWIVAFGYKIAVIEPDGSKGPSTQDIGNILSIYEARGTDHIDVIALPH